ncbi:MAG: hypothetical protein LBH44_06760 [Treponema sp.]|jgi:hypothetical protein|nr:hypothetical protein [Treponema sp.]
MQTDMHYYGTLAMAVAAGIPRVDAETIAYAAQFVDDSTGQDSNAHEDHGLLYAISTAHHPLQSFLDKIGTKVKEGTEEQRKIWVPFHFLPGGKGKILSEKLICVKNSGIAQEMLAHNLDTSLKKPFGLELMGITAHVYMDTFSHYGFSGMSSGFNAVNNETIGFTREPKTAAYITGKFKKFTEKYAVAKAAQAATHLGHAGVATYPDRPYLQWQFDFARPRPDNGVTSMRDNTANFLEGCKCLHGFFSKFAAAKYTETDTRRNFEDIKEAVRGILAVEDDMAGRVKAWKDSGLIDGCADYVPETWESGKAMFPKYAMSVDGIATNTYRFHQAATFHRYYVLKDLLPEHGIAVY